MHHTLYGTFGKRALDIALAILCLPFLLLATLVIFPLVMAEDGRPVLYRGARRGRNGQIFTMYKFRSMVHNAPDLRHADLSTLSSASDPRLTRIGRVLRRTSIDELPQLLNVIRGDMSVIGPRPNMTNQAWSELSAVERKRLEVRPGITGLNQAYHRNSSSVQKKYALDCYYVDHISPSLDLLIIGQTVLTVLGRKNIHSTREEGVAEVMQEFYNAD